MRFMKRALKAYFTRYANMMAPMYNMYNQGR